MGTQKETLAANLERIANELLVQAKALRGGVEKTDAPAGALKQAETGVCLVCDGKDQPKGRPLKRGQCVNCYAKTLRRLRDGKLSETRLIKLGKLLPAGVGGRRDSDFPLDALTEGRGKAEDLRKHVKENGSVQTTVQEEQEAAKKGKKRQ